MALHKSGKMPFPGWDNMNVIFVITVSKSVDELSAIGPDVTVMDSVRRKALLSKSTLYFHLMKTFSELPNETILQQLMETSAIW
jgi:hypothetical protein